MTNTRARIAALAVELGGECETNADLAAELEDPSVAELGTRVGVEQRRKAAPGECASDLAARAADRLLANTSRDSIDTLLFCTQSPDYFLPTSACLLQERLGLSRSVAALDLNQGSSGYIYGLWLAKALVESGQSRRLLLLTGDTYTRFLHPRDRSLRVLFGDAASATLIEPGEGAAGLGAFELGTDGSGARHLIVPAGGLRAPKSAATAEEATDAEGNVRSAENLYMNGTEIFRFAITQAPKTFRTLLAKEGVTADELDYVVTHQASALVLDHVAKRLGVAPEKAPRRFADVGNTVSTSIPIVLDALVREGRLRDGVLLALLGYGVGYSWGGCVVRWG